jgi:hypothetical protein
MLIVRLSGALRHGETDVLSDESVQLCAMVGLDVPLEAPEQVLG